MKKQRTRSPKTQGVFSPNKVAASEALRLNCDSRNLGPNVDMPAMSVASVAPARQSRMNVGFFRRSQMELQGRGMETRQKRPRVRVGQRQSPSHLNTKHPGSEGGVGGVQESRGHPTFTPRETKRGAGEHRCWDLEPVACWEMWGSQSLAPVWGETPRDRDATESAPGAAGRTSRGAWDRSGGRGQAAVIVQDWVATRRGDQGLQGG